MGSVSVMQQDCSLGGQEKRCSPFLCHLATGAGLILGALIRCLFPPLRLQPFTFR